VFIAKFAKVRKISEINVLEIGYTIVILKDKNVKVNVLILKSYRIAINDSIYGPK
jgi:hypothetical protein